MGRVGERSARSAVDHPGLDTQGLGAGQLETLFDVRGGGVVGTPCVDHDRGGGGAGGAFVDRARSVDSEGVDRLAVRMRVEERLGGGRPCPCVDGTHDDRLDVGDPGERRARGVGGPRVLEEWQQGAQVLDVRGWSGRAGREVRDVVVPCVGPGGRGRGHGLAVVFNPVVDVVSGGVEGPDGRDLASGGWGPGELGLIVEERHVEAEVEPLERGQRANLDQRGSGQHEHRELISLRVVVDGAEGSERGVVGALAVGGDRGKGVPTWAPGPDVALLRSIWDVSAPLALGQVGERCEALAAGWCDRLGPRAARGTERADERRHGIGVSADRDVVHRGLS